MAKQYNKIAVGTDIDTVKKKNEKDIQGQSKYGTEFASETNIRDVKKRNARSKGNKNTI